MKYYFVRYSTYLDFTDKSEINNTNLQTSKQFFFSIRYRFLIMTFSVKDKKETNYW